MARAAASITRVTHYAELLEIDSGFWTLRRSVVLVF
jgi:hypothetical protein